LLKLLIDEIVGIFTELEMKYCSSISAQIKFEVKEVATLTGSKMTIVVMTVGVGYLGLEDMSELKVRKYQEGI
jgi:hypothetical protein